MAKGGVDVSARVEGDAEDGSAGSGGEGEGGCEGVFNVGPVLEEEGESGGVSVFGGEGEEGGGGIPILR